ncbi:hypothetical protein EDB85DRAFT_2139893 [Lactarius pseudohatsudake]|nr:hypothetical protein EDB85DRAFT_2139893 [Lactarius pseudohatsudake]
MDNDDFNFEAFEDSDDGDLDLTSLGRPSSEHLPPRGDFGFDEGEMGSYTVGSQHEQRHQLRSRGQHSTVGSLPLSTVASRPRSHLSGPTQYSNPPAQHLYPRRIYSDSYPRPSPELIATLTVTELHDNPHYCRLRQKYERLTDIITAYAERDAMAHVVKREAVITAPDIFQVRGDADSRASSLGPSDSASQQTRGGLEADRAIERLLDTVEQPSLRPSFLPLSVLWKDKDCKMNASEEEILTEANPCRPKMALAIRCPDGSIASAQEFSNMRHSADIIVQSLVERVSSDSRTTGCGGSSKSLTKTFVKNSFGAEYRRAVLDLEAEQKLLRLCSGHWKADAMITKAFQRRNLEESKRKAATNCKRAPSSESNPSDAKDSQLLGPSPAVPLPQLWDTAPVNVAKRTLELSPGPKSPSASHAQKRSKDNTMYSGQKTCVPSNFQKPLGARDIAPTFLSRTEAISEPAPTNLRPRDVGPSADNLIAILKSQFPSLTNAPNLLSSMNAQPSFKQGKTSEKIMTLLERVRSADPGSPDIDEDNTGQSWGHYQFTAGDISPSSSLTSWKDVGSVATAFKLVAAAIGTCQEARLMCANAGTPRTTGFISDVYLEKTLECLESCWVDAGGTIASHSRAPIIPTTPSYRDVVMSSPARKLTTIKLKPLVLVPDVAPSDVPTGPGGPDATSRQPPAVVTQLMPPAASAEPTQPAVSTEPTPGPSTASDVGARADAKLLRSLHVSELQAWISEHKLSMPKAKRKEDLVVFIVKSTEFAQVSKSTIEKIIEKRKENKGPQKQPARLP